MRLCGPAIAYIELFVEDPGAVVPVALPDEVQAAVRGAHQLVLRIRLRGGRQPVF